MTPEEARSCVEALGDAFGFETEDPLRVRWIGRPDLTDYHKACREPYCYEPAYRDLVVSANMCGSAMGAVLPVSHLLGIGRGSGREEDPWVTACRRLSGASLFARSFHRLDAYPAQAPEFSSYCELSIRLSVLPPRPDVAWRRLMEDFCSAVGLTPWFSDAYRFRPADRPKFRLLADGDARRSGSRVRARSPKCGGPFCGMTGAGAHTVVAGWAGEPAPVRASRWDEARIVMLTLAGLSVTVYGEAGSKFELTVPDVRPSASPDEYRRRLEDAGILARASANSAPG